MTRRESGFNLNLNLSFVVTLTAIVPTVLWNIVKECSVPEHCVTHALKEGKRS